MVDMSDIRLLKQVLQQHRTIAVVGLSADWFRPSYFAAKYMQEHGYRIIPVNPKYPEILGETCYPDLASIPHPVDMVDVFRKPSDTPAIAAQAVNIGAKVLWLQLGVVNLDAQSIAVNTGVISAQRQIPPTFTSHG
jgi:uncharacterized protein